MVAEGVIERPIGRTTTVVTVPVGFTFPVGALHAPAESENCAVFVPAALPVVSMPVVESTVLPPVPLIDHAPAVVFALEPSLNVAVAVSCCVTLFGYVGLP